MKRKSPVVWGTTFVVAIIGIGVVGMGGRLAAQETSPAKPGVKSPAVNSSAKPAEKSDAKPINAAGQKAAHLQSPDDRSPDEVAIRSTGETFVKAYAAADSKAIGSHFTPDAEYIDEDGIVYHGRAEIQQAIAACFTAKPGAQMEMNIYSIRFVAAGVAIEDGTTVVTTPDDDEPVYTHYAAVHVKTDGKWLTASVREHAPNDRRQHRTQLQQLAWLQGDWVDESDGSLVKFSCKATDGGNFLVRDFVIHIAGQEVMRGTQRVGWDPLTGKLKSWTFDSEGGYSDGFWHRDDDRWVLKSSGVSADGQPASSTTIYTQVNEHTMTWQSVDHEIGGVEIPDSDVVTIVRRAPAPQSADDSLTSKSK